MAQHLVTFTDDHRLRIDRVKEGGRLELLTEYDATKFTLRELAKQFGEDLLPSTAEATEFYIDEICAGPPPPE